MLDSRYLGEIYFFLEFICKDRFFLWFKKEETVYFVNKKWICSILNKSIFMIIIPLISITFSPVYKCATNVRKTIRQLPLRFPKALDVGE